MGVENIRMLDKQETTQHWIIYDDRLHIYEDAAT
jgi:hypothetical protein